MKKRTLVIIAVVLAIILLIVVGSYQVDGPVRAVDPRLAVTLKNSAAWYGYRDIEVKSTDPDAVYVLVPGLTEDDSFAALRVDVHTGEQTATNIEIGPQSSFRPLSPARVRAEVHGIRFHRPAAHLLTFPDGGGPGLHFTDSATGRINVVLHDGSEPRVLLTRKAFNSSSINELLARVTADPNGRWIAAVLPGSDSWMLYLFSRTPNPTAEPNK